MTMNRGGLSHVKSPPRHCSRLFATLCLFRPTPASINVFIVSMFTAFSAWILASVCLSSLKCIRTNAETCAAQAMNSWVPQVVGFLVQGSSTGWWGLGCPAHCSSSLLVLGVTFSAGLGFGALGCLFLFRGVLLASPAPFASPAHRPSPPSSGFVPSARLRAYLHE